MKRIKAPVFFSFSLLFAAMIFCARCTNSGAAEKVTFTEHIAPLIYKNCASCHRDGGAGPFSLITYKEVLKKAKTIGKVTKDRIMPPWPADPTYSHFIGEKYLSDAEIELIQQWLAQGMPEGPADKLPHYEAPKYVSSIGQPDMTIALDTVNLYPDMRDRFFLIKIPGIIPRDTFVRAVEFVAGTPDLVHHFNGHLLLYEDGAKDPKKKSLLKTEITAGEYEKDFEKLDLLNDDGTTPFRVHSAVNYLPGVFGTAYPPGIGTFRLSKFFTFVGNDMHYGPSDRKVTDKSRINLFFTSTPPERETAEIMLGTNGVSKIEPPLKIPANKTSTHATRFRLPQDISVLTVNPHLHMLGKSFVAYAIKPNGDTIPLIRIKEWDFRWQYFYTFQKMVPVPRGSEIVAIATFDNTSKNINNPNHPPKEVGERLEFGGASMRATDEMFQFIITYTAFRPGDENVSLEVKK
jgi:mono/diheme cytochrome c family protein